MAAILHSVVTLGQLSYFRGGRLTKHNQGFIYLHKMIYNLCEAMLITHVARPLCLCPCVDRQAAFHQAWGWQAAVRRN